MDVRAKLDLRQAFMATEQDIARLWRVLADAGMKVEAAASCSDGLIRKFDTCDALSRYENPRRATIGSLEISARLWEQRISGEISLGRRHSTPVSFELSGPEEVVSAMRTSITDTVDGMKPWYSRAATVDLFNVGLLMYVPLSFLYEWRGPPSFLKSVAAEEGVPATIAIWIMLFSGYVLSLYLLSVLRRRVFPVATFAIGQGHRRHESVEAFRWGVVIALLIGVASSFVYAWAAS